MTEPLYSKQEHAQFRGPTNSSDYNERIENLYKDLMVNANKVGLLEEDVRLFFQRIIKEHYSLAKIAEDLEARLDALEATDTRLTFGDPDAVDNDRFNSTEFAISTDNRLFWDSQHNLFTLPKVETSSFSKLKFQNSDGQYVIPSSFEAIANGYEGTADSVAATLDTSDVYNAVLQEIGTIWERNVIVAAPDPDGAVMTLHVRFPTDLVVNENTNCIVVHPFPVMGCDLLEVAYTTQPNVSLNSSDNYQPLNVDEFYANNSSAIGWVPPGGWSGDSILNCGPKAFYFDPKTITGLRIKLRQKNYYVEDNKYIYSYGLSKLDARYEKFLDTGKFIVRFDAPTGQTISDVSDVEPRIWNVAEADLPNLFSYRTIWETAYNSGVYTTTPVPLSQRVWVEVTLAKTTNNGTPALSGLNIEYS